MSFILLGILNSQVTGAAPAGGPSFDLLETEIVPSNTASVSFDVTSFASDYRHLQIRGTARSTNSSAASATILNFNSDFGSNYNQRYMRGGDGTTVGGGGNNTKANLQLDDCPAATSGANLYSGFVCDILDAFDTTKWKTIRTLSGAYPSANQFVEFWTGSWENNNAITTIDLSMFSGLVAANSRFSVYGVK